MNDFLLIVSKVFWLPMIYTNKLGTVTDICIYDVTIEIAEKIAKAVDCTFMVKTNYSPFHGV